MPSDYYLRACTECGGKTYKHDICAKCRHKPSTVSGISLSREETNKRVNEIMSMAKEEAKKQYEIWNQRWLSGETTDEVRHWRAQMRAIIEREVITEDTLI